MSVWMHREEIPTPIPATHTDSVAAHKRVQVRTRSGRLVEMERIQWTNGMVEVTATDYTFGRLLHRWANYRNGIILGIRYTSRVSSDNLARVDEVRNGVTRYTRYSRSATYAPEKRTMLTQDFLSAFRLENEADNS